MSAWWWWKLTLPHAWWRSVGASWSWTLFSEPCNRFHSWKKGTICTESARTFWQQCLKSSNFVHRQNYVLSPAASSDQATSKLWFILWSFYRHSKVLCPCLVLDHLLEGRVVCVPRYHREPDIPGQIKNHLVSKAFVDLTERDAAGQSPSCLLLDRG